MGFSFEKRKQMVEKMIKTAYPKSEFSDYSEKNLLDELEKVTEEISQLETQKAKATDRATRESLELTLEEKYETNSMIFEVLFKKYGYNISADDICEVLDIDLPYFFLSTKYYFHNQVKVTTGATRFIKKFIFKEEEYGLKRENPNLEVAQHFQALHRKKLFFTQQSVEVMLSAYCEVRESRMFLDINLQGYVDREGAERAIQQYLLEKGYLKVVIKEVTDRKTKKKVRKEVVEPVPQPGSLFPIVSDIMNGNIELLAINHFKEQVVRNHCKASRKVHDQQVKRFLAKSDEIEFIKFAVPGRQQQPNMRFYARHTPKQEGHFRVAVGWGTDTEELQQELLALIEEFKEEKQKK